MSAFCILQAGYSTAPARPGAWQRLLVTVDNEHGVYRLYLDGEDAAMDVARVRIYADCLSPAEAAELAGVGADDPANRPPVVWPALTGPSQTLTGQAETYGFTAFDPESEAMRLRIDWGDGGDVSAWSAFGPSGTTRSFTHAYRQPGNYLIRALAQDARGQTGPWAAIWTISVAGTAVVEFLTPPYCELWVDGDESLRQTLVPLMEAYGVDGCFSGHTHEYSRGELQGVHYCITGGGSWLDFPEVLVRDWEHMTVGGYHPIAGVTRPGPDRGGGLVNECVRVDVRGQTFTASMLGFAPDGTPLGLLDWFSKTNGAAFPGAELLYAEDFEGVPGFGLPAGWVADHRTAVDANTLDPENPRSNTYLTWTVVSAPRLARVFGSNRLSVPDMVRGHSEYAESDHRLAPFVQGRVNNDPIGSKRVERRRLIGADRQRTVRLRFTLIGTSIWFWGLDDFQLWGVRSAAESLAISRVTATPEGLRIEWTGADGPYQLQHSPVLPAELWLDHGAPLPASQRSVVVPPGEPASFFRLRLAR